MRDQQRLREESIAAVAGQESSGSSHHNGVCDMIMEKDNNHAEDQRMEIQR